MRKALAQNPNLLRTLLGLSFTLVFILSYAVYGATVDSSYFVYENEVDETVADTQLISNNTFQRNGENWTTWTWQFTTDGQNLTWVNATVSGVASDGEIRLLNVGAGFWSHPSLGNAEAHGFSCAEQCYKAGVHSADLDSTGEGEVVALTHWEAGRRDGGTVRAENLQEAEEMAAEIVEYNHSDNGWQIIVEMPGEHENPPAVLATQVNEEFSSVEKFEVDPATELLWALAAVIGCFTLLLVPSFAIYFASQAKRNMAETEVLGLREAE